MKKSLSGFFLLATFSLTITGCAGTFKNSPMGIEAGSMLDICVEMKKNGLLPGIDSDEDTHFELKIEGMAFSKRNDVTYPLQLDCILVKDSQEQSFPFIKQSSNSEWKLSQ